MHLASFFFALLCFELYSLYFIFCQEQKKKVHKKNLDCDRGFSEAKKRKCIELPAFFVSIKFRYDLPNKKKCITDFWRDFLF